MNDVLQDRWAASLAIPDIGYDWSDHRLKALGVEVQAQYPELVDWPPYLAAEAHLYYNRRFPGDPSKVQARSTDFLAFLRATISRHVAQPSAVVVRS